MAHWGLLFAQDKGSGYFSETTVAERVYDLNTFYGLPKWGLVIYRCTYGDDERWARFMARLNTHKNSLLRDYYHKPELVDAYDWSVQENPSLEGATKDEVRRRFRQWVSTTSQAEIPDGLEGFKKDAIMRESPRYNYCIHVDLDAMKSVTPPPPVLGGPDVGPMEGYVNLVRADKDWDLPDFDRFDWGSHKSAQPTDGGGDGGETEGEEDEDEGDDEDDYDEGEPEIEGSRLHDVGWMMVSAESLIPETYGTLIRGFLWDKLYVRPPKVMER